MHALRSALSAVGLLVAVCWLTPISALAACKCTDLKVRTSGHTDILCSDKDLHFEDTECKKYKGSEKGCNEAFAYDCNLGVNSKKYTKKAPSQQFGFLSRASLTKESKPEDCHTGELLQMNIKSNDKNEPNPKINPTSIEGKQKVGGRDIFITNDANLEVQQIGAETEDDRPWFGGDNYGNYKDDKDVLSVYNGAAHQLFWWDNTDQEKDNHEEKASWHYAYISFVQGSDGDDSSCACAFDVKVDWPSGKNKSPTTSVTFNKNASKNCSQ